MQKLARSRSAFTDEALVFQVCAVVALQEVGLGNIERCRGFTSHMFKLLLRQRRRLARLSEQWVQLRSGPRVQRKLVDVQMK